MVVEVTLQRPTQTKSCWFPFKEKISNRRLLQDRTQTEWYDNLSSSRSSKRTARVGSARTPRGTESVSTGTDTSSFAGYSEQDSRTTTSSSSNMPSSASASRFSHATNSVSNLSLASHSVSHISHFTHSASNISQPMNVVESAILNSPLHQRSRSSHVDILPPVDEEDSIALVNPIAGTSDRLSHDLEPTIPLAFVETNCMAKEFWTDEMVDGGAFSCFQHTEIAKRCLRIHEREDVLVLHEVQRTVTFNSIVEEKENSENADDLYTTPGGGLCSRVGSHVASALPPNDSDRKDVHKKTEEGVLLRGTATKSNRGSRGIPSKPLYIAEEPEVVKVSQPLRRALCHNIRMKRQQNKLRNHLQKEVLAGQSSLSRMHRVEPPILSQPSRELLSRELPRQEVKTIPKASTPEVDFSTRNKVKRLPLMAPLPSTTSWRETEILPNSCLSEPLTKWVGTKKTLTLKNLNRDEETPNFYVEVEAMSAQLDGIRDLDEIKAEEGFRGDKMEIARTASLVDDDSAFRDSVNQETEEAVNVDVSPKRSKLLVPGRKQGTETKGNLSVEHMFPAGHGSENPGSNPQTTSANGINSQNNHVNSGKSGSVPNPRRNLETEQTSVRRSEGVTDRISVVRKQAAMVMDKTEQLPSFESMNKKADDWKRFSDRFPDHGKEREVVSSLVQQRIQSTGGSENVASQGVSKVELRKTEKENQINRVEKSISEKHSDRTLEMKSERESQDLKSTTYPKPAEKNNLSPPRHSLHPLSSSKQFATSGWKPTTPMSILSDDTYDWNAGLMSEDENSDLGGRGEGRTERHPGKGRKFQSDANDQVEWERSDIGYYRRVGSKPRDKLKRTNSNRIERSWSLDANVPDAPQIRPSQSLEQSLDYPIPYSSNVVVRDRSSGSKKSDQGSTNPKFDDNFWKEDEESDLNTAAFEVYGSENDSLFGDLKSTASVSTSESSSKSSEPSGPFRRNQVTERDSEREYRTTSQLLSQSGDFSKHSRADLSRYTDHSASKYSRFSRGDTMALTTYLEGDGQLLACMDKWLDDH